MADTDEFETLGEADTDVLEALKDADTSEENPGFDPYNNIRPRPKTSRSRG
jgi:hypothetical protein